MLVSPGQSQLLLCLGIITNSAPFTLEVSSLMVISFIGGMREKEGSAGRHRTTKFLALNIRR